MAQRTRNRCAAATPRPMAGFTVLELVIVVTLAGILATIAIPSFSGLIAEQRAKAVATDLVLALTRARSEAIKRNANVSLTPVDADDWAKGWQITDASSNVLDSHGAAPAQISIGATLTGSGNSVIYQNSGRIDPALTGTVAFEITSAQYSTGYRCVTTDLSGRPNTKKTTPCP